MEWSVFYKFIQFVRGLEQSEQLAFFGGGATSLAPLLYLLWNRGRHSGFEDGKQHVLDGRVRDLEFEILKLQTALQNTPAELQSAREQIKALQQDLEIRKATGPSIPPEVDAILDCKEKVASENVNVWELRDPIIPRYYFERFASNSLKILLIGNLKGGVGKTTLTANLAAYFEIKKKKKVLLIDLDYQGSLTATMLQAARKGIRAAQADFLLTGVADGEWVCDHAESLDLALPKTRLVTAGYTLAQREEQLLMKWVFRISQKDPRYSLAEILLSEAVQKNFEVVLIDVGPRLTAASLAGLYASTYLIVPTNLDKLSAETVASFLATVKDLKQRRNLPIQLAGVVGTMTFQNALTEDETSVLNFIRSGVKEWGEEGHIFQRTIPRKKAISDNAGLEIGYLLRGGQGNELKAIFNTLGDEISARVGL